MIENKENVLLDDEVTTIGESSTLPHRPGEPNREDHDPYLLTNCTVPPIMTYTNSLTFSDISMPFPSLSTFNSLGPNGILQQQNNYPAVPTTQLQNYTSFGQVHGSYLSQFYTPRNTEESEQPHYLMQNNFSNSQLVTVNDLNIAASALLDLTPTIPQHELHRDPSSCTETAYFNINQGRAVKQSRNQREMQPLSRRKKVVLDVNEKESDNSFILVKANIESRAQELLNDTAYTIQACKCKNSHCLKLYCNCFQTGTLCDALVCQCRGCENNAEHSIPRGSRTRAIYEVLHRRLDAFGPRQRKRTGFGCSCKKSRYGDTNFFGIPYIPIFSTFLPFLSRCDAGAYKSIAIVSQMERLVQRNVVVTIVKTIQVRTITFEVQL
jgi:Tesmin/TSO1-like CXC domain, cysteine-rich domain